MTKIDEEDYLILTQTILKAAFPHARPVRWINVANRAVGYTNKAYKQAIRNKEKPIASVNHAEHSCSSSFFIHNSTILTRS